MMSPFLPIEHYLPHRDTMLLVDQLLEASEEHAVAQLRVPRDSPFVENGVLPSWVTVEYMAQTIAAWAGYQAVQKNEPVKIGFLLGTRRFESTQSSVPAGAELRVHARCELQAGNGLGMFSCAVHTQDMLVAQAQLSVYEPEDGVAFVQASGARRGEHHE